MFSIEKLLEKRNATNLLYEEVVARRPAIDTERSQKYQFLKTENACVDYCSDCDCYCGACDCL
jgi:hypothetical protein